MKFVLFVEGASEKKSLPQFLKRWLDSRLPSPVGIRAVEFAGLSDYYSGITSKTALYLNRDRGDVIAGIGLLDLYGPTFYPSDRTTPDEKYRWAKEHLEKRVSHPLFRQHFAVHEMEAWLLAQPEILHPDIQRALPERCSRPETVNFNEPPAKLLTRLYRERLRGRFKKTFDGANLFQRLSPDRAYEKCPYFKAMLDDMLALAQNALR
jgi:Domain of unknown function (DUF4276)